MNGPLFSIVVTAYNQAPFLAAMLRSIEDQTCRDFELIVVDDGSVDETLVLLRAWRQRFARTEPNRVILDRIDNSGQSAALEHGFGLAAGRYVCLLDADDLFLPWKLECLAAAALADPEAGMLVHPMYVVDEGGTRTGDIRPKAARLAHGDLRAQVRRDARTAVPGTSAITLKADLLDRMLPMPTRNFKTMADAYLPLAASLLAPVHVLSEPLAEYRMHQDGAHLRSLISPGGLAAWLDVQWAVARHLGIEPAMRRNPTYARNAFVLARLTRGWVEGLFQYPRLAAATLGDSAFGAARRLQLLAWWTLLACSPQDLFERQWRWFLERMAGAAPVPQLGRQDV